ncbi:MAG: prenyltransferase [Marinilabiliales bacterium]|nr:MAG: prenyltransferase [Marinilabiliales bacterium]
MIRDLASLFKLRLSLAVAFTGVAGVFLGGNNALTWLWVLLGVFLLSCGAAGLNHVQERDSDALMKRTATRPVASGRIVPEIALLLSLLVILAGLILLILTTNNLTMLLGAFNVLWYNVVYTPLKRKSALAFFPGALCGAIPPLMGFAATGSLWNPAIITFALFIFLWQIPHFWLVALKYGEEYQNAGIPPITDLFSVKILKPLIVIWMLATIVLSQLLWLFYLPATPVFYGAFISVGLIAVVVVISGLFRGEIRYTPVFIAINSFMLFITVAVVVMYW